MRRWCRAFSQSAAAELALQGKGTCLVMRRLAACSRAASVAVHQYPTKKHELLTVYSQVPCGARQRDGRSSKVLRHLDLAAES